MFARVKEAIAATTGAAAPAASAAAAVSPEKILVPALAKLQKDASGRYGNAQVKKAAEDALAQLSQLQGSADPAFPALYAACASKTPKYMTTALDCMEKLLARGFLGRTPEMATKVIKVISACSEQADDAVQLQVVKALLTGVTSGIAHESNLLLALRACYHIHLVSENAVNRTTSKVSLTQMMSWVFVEVEKQAHVTTPVPQPEPIVPSRTATTSPVSVPTTPAPKIEVPKTLPLGDGMYPVVQETLGYAAGGDTPAQESEEANRSEEAPVENGGTGKAEAVEAQAVVSEVGEGVQPSIDALKSQHGEDDEHNQAASVLFVTPAHKDAFLVLRTLSKLSMKAISFEDISATGDEGKADPRALKSKLLSLELLLSVFEQAGPQLKHVGALVYAIKQYLIPALMKNCMEVNTQVAQIAMKVFEQVQLKFKDQLKKEVELVISTVFLGLLDSPHASFENRVLVLEVLNRMCGSTQMMMEIFLNYDCDWNSQDLLRQITDALCKASLTRMSKDGESEKMLDPDLANSKKLRAMGLSALAVLIKSLASYATMETANEDTTSTAAPQAEEENPQSSSTQASKLASAALDSFQQKQTYKRDLETAIAKFNEKPKEGIKFLRERGHLDQTPQSVAKFLYDNQNVLSKSMIGDYLGDSNEANVQILYAYTELFEFKGKTIDEAIRVFLSAFRIPGEAQKIDRVMEKFASKYWQQNPEVFPSADTAFVLSYAIIMLQTDAHNPNIKPEKKMKKADFLKNNRGIASGRDLSPEFLGGIYDRIVAKPITLKGDDVDAGDAAATAAVEYYDAKGKRKAFFKERQEILNEAEQLRKAKAGAVQDEKATQTFFLVEHSFAMSEHVAPMFMVMWKAMSTAFRANLLNTDDPAIASICLDGMYNCIRVAGRFRLDDERAALIEMLAGLSKLDAPLEIEPKNVMCVQAITAIAVTEGNYIGNSWVRILQCVSELSRLLLMTPTGEDDSVVDMPTTEPQAGKKRPGPIAIDPAMKAQYALKRVVDYTAVDRIFVRSVNLNEQAIVDFVDALIVVSRAELLLKTSGSSGGNGPPLKKASGVVGGGVARARLFALQKIVEVADFNINTRPRYTWGRMWEKLSQHFAASGCHPSPQVAMYAVDSLKQLSLKFLNKDEFVGFAFQDRFLRPFEEIIKNSASPDVRALVLHCMQNFIVGKSKNIKSGWGAVFDVIAASATDPVKENMTLGFSLLEMSQQYHAPPFLFAQGALKFAHANDSALSTKCLEFAEAYAGSAYLPDVPPEQQTEQGDSPQKARELFKGLSAFSTADPRENVRRQALISVFTILKNALEDRADPAIVSRLFADDVLAPWTAAFFEAPPASESPDSVVAVSTLVGGPRWPFSTLSYVVAELIRFLALALYEIAELPELNPEDFARKRTGGPEDDGDAPLVGKLSPHARESAFLGLLDSAFKFFEKLSEKDDRATSAVAVASYNYALDVLGSHFSAKAWKMLLESLGRALKAASPAHLNTPDVLRALGLLGNPSADEAKITSLSLDELSKQTPDDGVFVPQSNAAAPVPSSSLPAEAPKPVVALQVPDLKAAEVKVVTNLGLVKLVCRILRRPFEKAELVAKTCDILEQALADASAFDDNHPLRIELSRRGFVKEGSEKPQKEGIIKPLVPPDALEVEVLAAQTLLKHMQTQKVRDEQRFERVLVGLVNRYLHQDRILAAEQTFKPKSTSGPSVQTVGTTKSESEKELLALTPVVLFALRGVLEMEGAPVGLALPWVFPLLLQLIECPNRDVRAIVRRILEKHVTPRLSFH